MKILQIASGDFFSTYGGGQVYVKNLVNEMIAQDADLSIISFVPSINQVQHRNYKSRNLLEVPESVSTKALTNLICDISTDIIHAHSHNAQICRIGKELGIPVVVTAHHGGIVCPAGACMNTRDEICLKKINHKDCLPCMLRNVRTGKYWYPFMRLLPESKYKKLGQFLTSKGFIPFITPIGSSAWYINCKQREWNEVAEKCTVMIAPSNAIAEAMTTNGLPKEKIRVIPHGIPLPAQRPEFPEIKDGKIKFYYVGRISYVKGLHILIRAFRGINNPDIELHIIGGPGNTEERRYEQKLHSLCGNDHRIIWHGKIPAEVVFEKCKDFHVAVSVPIYLEVFGLNIAEALALGKPVLVTRCGGAEMQIEDGINGWIIEPNSVSVLKDQIDYIAVNMYLLKGMHKNCNAIPICKHTEALLSLYSATVHP